MPDSSYIGSVADSVYFLAKCAAAQGIAKSNRRIFATWQDAEKAGFKHSRVVGC